MHSRVYSAQSTGLDPKIIEVEVDVGRGLHSFSIVGLPDKAVEEAKDRICAAIKNSGFIPPNKGNKKIVVNLAPADLKKEGSSFDLPIAIANLIVSDNIFFEPNKKIFIGELSLTGEIRPVKGVLMSAMCAKNAGFKEIYIPKENAKEASLVSEISVYPCTNLKELVEHLDNKTDNKILPERFSGIVNNDIKNNYIDFSDIVAQENAKRGLEIAAAGKHNVLIFGPPGTGKSMLAKGFVGILPPLTFPEVLEVTGIHSVSGLLGGKIMTEPPIRSPHHTASYSSIIGGGTTPSPGEVTLAHRGVLFLDEFTEFERKVIESLRQPIEDNQINISRSKGSVLFPSNFILLAAMNLCPCGNEGKKGKSCICSGRDIIRYKKKISGPISDRIDIFLDAPEIEHEKLSSQKRGEKNSKIRKRVEDARKIQYERFKNNKKITTNSDMTIREIKDLLSNMSSDVKLLLNTSSQKLNLSPRAYHKVIKVAQTISDLEGAPYITEYHLLEALQYRPKEYIL